MAHAATCITPTKTTGSVLELKRLAESGLAYSATVCGALPVVNVGARPDRADIKR